MIPFQRENSYCKFKRCYTIEIDNVTSFFKKIKPQRVTNDWWLKLEINAQVWYQIGVSDPHFQIQV